MNVSDRLLLATGDTLHLHWLFTREARQQVTHIVFQNFWHRDRRLLHERLRHLRRDFLLSRFVVRLHVSSQRRALIEFRVTAFPLAHIRLFACEGIGFQVATV